MRQHHKVTNNGNYAIRVYFWPGTSSQMLFTGKSVSGDIHHIDHGDAERPMRYSVEPVDAPAES